MIEHATRETAATLALLRAPVRDHRRILADALDAESALRILHERLGGALPIGEDPVEMALAEAEGQIAAWATSGITTLSVFDEAYPARLRSIKQMPPLIFTRGLLRDDHRAVAVVGSRSASPDRLRVASTIARTLAQHDVTVVSGLARGVDTAAHTGALTAGGRTVAVIASGPDISYPPENAELHETIAAAGLLLSAYAPGTPVAKEQFLARNAIMSGYAAATIVVEAEYRSGARAQARMALEHGRPVVFPEHLLRHEWARDYAGNKPGVYVAKDPDHLAAIVEMIIESLDLTADPIHAERLFAW
ncbi:DNA-processing protein DprA [Longispora albida]|uniref:DNA-processing protein DprA n=1 Tax=Longispora albida TaxID=203523 RepID=UPI00036239A7|nr:DNA-processing protein DprA [Longispora albida]